MTHHLLRYLFICILAAYGTLSCVAQNPSGNNHYLIDSLDFSNVNAHNKNLVDSLINVYHNHNNDTSRYQTIEYLVEQCDDNSIWPKYNQWLITNITATLNQKYNEPKTRKALTKSLAGAYNNLGYNYGENGQTEQQIFYYKKSLLLRLHVNDIPGAAASFNNLGYVHKIKGLIPEALHYYRISAELYLLTKDTTGLALSNTNLGVLYENMGDMYSASSCYLNSLRYYQQLGDEKGEAQAYYNLGSLYKSQNDLRNARLYYIKSLNIRKRIDYKVGIGYSYNSLGQLKQMEGQHDSAIYYFQQGYQVLTGNNKIGEATCLANMGNSLLNLNRPEDAIPYLEKALQIQQEINHSQGIAQVQINLGKAKLAIGKLGEAKAHVNEGITISQDLGFPANIRDAAKVLSDIYKKENNYGLALSYFELYASMKDSVANNEIEKSAFKQQTQFEFEKKQAISDLAHEKAMEQVALEKEMQRYISLSAGVVLVLVIVFALVIWNRLLITRKQKQTIEEQKQEVVLAHNTLTQRNKEILDSINYAQKIQRALLKSENKESAHLPDHFILFKPKDIISGDFYWAMEKQNYLYVAVADCTGHGVPGALLTMLGTSYLNEINAEDTLLTPAQILEQLRSRIIKDLNQTGNSIENKDGMDVSIARIPLEVGNNFEVVWAGANNPLYVISAQRHLASHYPETLRKDGPQNLSLWSIPCDKQPVGWHPDPTRFTDQTIPVQRGDVLCLFTDGFADQFGGPRGKKYKYSALKETLMNLQRLPIAEQKTELDREFEQWRGSLEQVDDVCLMVIQL